MTPITVALLLLVLSPATAQNSPTRSTAGDLEDWRTPSERSEYRTTPRYDETMAYVRRVAAAAPAQVKVEVFGKTGRELVNVVVSRDGVFDPEVLHRTGRPILLVQNAIHAGEMDGKDSCVALLRDMVITKTQARLLERAVVIITPSTTPMATSALGRSTASTRTARRKRAGGRTLPISTSTAIT